MYNDAHLVAYSPYAKFEHIESFDLLLLEKQHPVGVTLPRPYTYEVSNAYPGT